LKLLVFGNSGSGKSTYARAMAAQYGMPHLDLDSIVWAPGKIAVQRAAADIAAALADFLANNSDWIIECCYGELVTAAAPHCTELIFLNPGLEACLANNIRRPWEPHKYASREAQDAMLANLQEWVAGYYERGDDWSYMARCALYNAHTGAKREVMQPSI
jgi:adenylate kinase family enzyme